MVCFILFFKNVKLMFWDDAVLCVVYVKKRCPSYAIRNKTSCEMSYGHILLVNHLRVFGSTCYVLILKVQRNKLGARSRKCIFLGYSNTSKSYHLWDEVNKKFFVSRDAILLNLTKLTMLLNGSLIAWIDSDMQNHSKNLIIRFHILKGGFLYLISLWNLLLKHSLPHMKLQTR